MENLNNSVLNVRTLHEEDRKEKSTFLKTALEDKNQVCPNSIVGSSSPVGFIEKIPSRILWIHRYSDQNYW